MAIVARSVGTRSGSTLMGRVLPDPIKNRVGFAFLKKNPKRVRVFCKTQLEPKPGPDPTRLQVKKITKKTLLYIYIYIYL